MLMNAGIKKIIEYSGRPTKRARVFVESNASSIADDWFSENEVYSLRFKSKTWAKMGRLLHKINGKYISELLECNTKDVKYSANCGCSSCPCSPGYNVYNTNKNGKGIWVNIQADGAELKPLKDYINIANLELQVEISEFSNK
jgi:hypothetical protein